MMAIQETWPSKRALATSELGPAAFIPYACHYDPRTLLTKNGQLLQVLQIEGFSFESADADEIEFKKRLRNMLFKSVSTQEYALWFHIVRKRQPVYPAGEFEAGFAELLNAQWKMRHAEHQLFDNALYITILRRSMAGPGGLIPSSWTAFSQPRDAALREAALRSAAKDLADVARRFETTLAEFGARILEAQRVPAGVMSEPLRFLSQLVNLEQRDVLVPQMDLSRYLPYKRLFFGQNAMECRGATGSKFAAILSIKEYSPDTAPGMLDGFFHLPFEYILTQSFVSTSRQGALNKLQLQQRRMEQTDDLAVSQVQEIDEALEEATSGAYAFGEHHLTVMPIVHTLAELDPAVAQVETELMNLGIVGVREDLNMEPCFWAQLPGNFEHVARRSTISTANVAGFVSLHNYPTGKADENHWGPAVTLLQTKSGTPYFFNFHAADVGHTTIIGPTGAGKTALLNFLCAQAQKFHGRLFYFDRNRGAEIFVRALGGAYSVLTPGKGSGFNPLRLEDTPENRSFLSEWLKSLLVAYDPAFTNEDLLRVATAVAGNFKLPMEHRTLANVSAFLGMSGPGRLASRLAPWHSEGPLKDLFGGEEDMLRLDQPIMGFEMGKILESPECLTPVLLYLFHRIAAVLDGTPTMIVLDEAWGLLKNPIFATRIEQWLKTFRKLNALVIFATQSVEDAIDSPISRTLISETATHIYFPNPKATEAYRSVFKLSERELHLIREVLDRESRFFLLKHGRDSVVAKVDLKGMPEIMAVLSGRAETVARMQQLRGELGDHPDAWLSVFMEDFYECREADESPAA
jgi:type IV secretion system protein VirB4